MLMKSALSCRGSISMDCWQQVAPSMAIALVDSGEPRRAVELPQQLCLQALAAVRAVHKRGLQRCNPKLHILLYRPGRTLFCDNVNPAHLAPHSSILSTEPNLASCLLCTSAVI